MAIQQRQHVDVVERRTFFNGLFGMSIFDVLRIPGGCSAPTSIPLVAELFNVSVIHFNIILPPPPLFIMFHIRKDFPPFL
jgi:hypothetical protein